MTNFYLTLSLTLTFIAGILIGRLLSYNEYVLTPKRKERREAASPLDDTETG